MIIYRTKYYNSIFYTEDDLKKDEKTENERKKNIENRTKHNTFLSNYRTPGTDWSRDVAKQMARRLDKKGYSDEDILKEAGGTSFFDKTAWKGAGLGGSIGAGAGLVAGIPFVLKKLKNKPLSKFTLTDLDTLQLTGGLGWASGNIIGGGIGYFGAKKNRKEAVKELLEMRKEDELKKNNKNGNI
jgi:hypothetical protein